MSTHDTKLVTMLRAKFRGWENSTDANFLAAYACWRTVSRGNWQDFPNYLNPANRKMAWTAHKRGN